MKRVLLVALMSISVNGMAQEASKIAVPQTRPAQSVTGFGGVLFEVSQLYGQATSSVGGGGAALFNNRFFLGGFGQSTVGATAFIANGVTHETQYRQGGLWLGYISTLNQTLSLVSDVRLGWANISLQRLSGATYNSRGFMTTPSVSLRFQPTQAIAVHVGVGYRLASSINLPLTDVQGRITDHRLTSQDFSGATGTLSVLFGGF
jgi:hypothetical protein